MQNTLHHVCATRAHKELISIPALAAAFSNVYFANCNQCLCTAATEVLKKLDGGRMLMDRGIGRELAISIYRDPYSTFNITLETF